jgi:hypothetical protein
MRRRTAHDAMGGSLLVLGAQDRDFDHSSIAVLKSIRGDFIAAYCARGTQAGDFGPRMN